MADFYSKGQIVDIDLGKSPREVIGHEQANTRPCVIIKSFTQLGLLIVIPITGTFPSHSLYTIVKIISGEGGLTKDSYVLCHQIRTVSIKRVVKKRGIIAERSLNKIISILQDTLEI